MVSEESIIRDNVNDFSDDELQYDVHKHVEPRNQSELSSYFETISSQLSEIKSTQILIRTEGELVQMTFMKA